jgi:imidazolonepropionase
VASIAITNIGELTTNDAAAGAGRLGRRHDAGLVLDQGVVAWIGASKDTPAADHSIDAGTGSVIPGFVDAHTHLVFAGDRADEFEARMAGAPFDGGGILRTVAATRAASTAALDRAARRRLADMLATGTTTVEVKSGYELSIDGERRLLDVAAGLTDEVTWLGAHVLPKEFASRRDEYVRLLIGPMLERCAPVSRWADAFCDPVAFSVEECRAVLQAAASSGLGIRVHANQLGDTGGVELAAELGAASVDHCTFCSARGASGLAERGVVATLVPAAEFLTRSAYADARQLLDAGVTVALATDCNPGTSYVTSMPFVIALAVRELGMTSDEALYAATAGGAAALRRDDVGRLGIGHRADLVVLDAPSASHLAYRPGSPLVRDVLRRGERASSRARSIDDLGQGFEGARAPLSS